MVPQVRKILYASDLSDNSMPALAWAMMLADRHDARISFLHVIEEVSPSTMISIQSFMGEEKWKQIAEGQHGEVNAKMEERIHRFCEKVKSEMESCPLVVSEIVINRGVPVENILHEAESRQCDLIAMGTHGAGLFKGAMIGGTARRVLRRSKVPVFVIPLPNEPQ